MSNYYEMQDAKVKLMHRLEKLGFKIYGYKQDESDIMTDYFSPASWSGIATIGEYVVVVDQYQDDQSGFRAVIRYQRDPEAPCRDCKGTGKSTEGNPGLKDRYGLRRDDCIPCHGKGLMTKRVETRTPHPTFKANPQRTNWHVEKDGEIIAKGTGLIAANLDDAKMNRIVERIVSSVPSVTFAKVVEDTESAPKIEEIPAPVFTEETLTVENAEEARTQIAVKQMFWSDSCLVDPAQIRRLNANGYTEIDHDAIKKMIAEKWPALTAGDYTYSSGDYLTDWEYVVPAASETFAETARIPMRRVVINWSESNLVKGGEMFNSWRDANAFIERIASARGERGGYDKTGFTVYFEDGHIYTGRIDITRKYDDDCNLSLHIRRHVAFYAGLECPPHLTTQQRDQMLRNLDADCAEYLRGFLDRYLLTEDPYYNPQPTERREVAEVISLAERKEQKRQAIVTPVERLQLRQISEYLTPVQLADLLANGATVATLYERLAKYLDEERRFAPASSALGKWD